MRVKRAGSRRHMPGSSGKLVEQSPTTGGWGARLSIALPASVPRIGRPDRSSRVPSDAKRNFTALGQRGVLGIPIAVNTGGAMDALAMRFFRRSIE
jgi:hypothetical protein